jgi:hypothetical protein
MELDGSAIPVHGGMHFGRQPTARKQDARAVAFVAAANAVAPFFARENEPSPIASSQSIRRSRSSFPNRRSHAAWKAPLLPQDGEQADGSPSCKTERGGASRKRSVARLRRESARRIAETSQKQVRVRPGISG